MENRCVCCDAIIPEGRQVCKACEGSHSSEIVAIIKDFTRRLLLTKFQIITSDRTTEVVTAKTIIALSDNIIKELSE